MEKINTLIEKIESETLAYYSAEELIEMLEDLKHSIFNRNFE
jgi:hypothetical protein